LFIREDEICILAFHHRDKILAINVLKGGMVYVGSQFQIFLFVLRSGWSPLLWDLCEAEHQEICDRVKLLNL
jgi:hypothetical protein